MSKFLTVLLGFAEGSATVFSSDDCSAVGAVAVVVDAFGLWIGLSSVSTASVLATASMLTAAGMSACDELRLEFRLERSIINFYESLLFKDEFERSSSPPRFLASPRPVSRSKRRTILATLRG